MVKAGDITEGEVIGWQEAEVDTQDIKLLEVEKDTLENAVVGVHTW